MDEFETIESPAVLDLVGRIIRHEPANSHLVIGSRNMPKLGLGRLRANNQLLEIGSADLRFSFEETVDFLRNKSRLSLDDGQCRLLQRHTEGWPAALHLAALSLSSGNDRDDFVAKFSGSNTSVADYLVEDVLAKLPDKIRVFLLRTSVLSELCGPLCDAVADCSHSEELLAKLESMNLFLSPLDDRRLSYRYHGLFASFLRAQLERRHPELPSALHATASRWYAAQGQPVVAIEHALASKNMALVLSLLSEHAPGLVNEGRPGLLARWYTRISPTAFDSRPKLLIPFAWALASTRRRDEALRLADEALRVATGGPDEEDIRAWCLAIKIICRRMLDEPVIYVERDWPAVKTDSLFVRGYLEFGKACCLLESNRPEEAAEAFIRAGANYASLKNSLMLSLTERGHAMLDFSLGHLHSARERLRRMYQEVVAAGSHHLSLGATTCVLLAEALYQGDELDEAEKLLTQYLVLAIENGVADVIVAGYVTLARIAYAHDDRARAVNTLSTLEHLGHAEGLPRLAANHWLERSRIALQEGDLTAADLYLQYASNPEVWKCFVPVVMHANDVDTLAIGRLRLLIRSGEGEKALPQIKQQLQEAEDNKRRRRALKLKILLAEALHRCGQTKPALRIIRETLQIASAEGFIRTFAEEGSTVAHMLSALREQSIADADITAETTVPTEFLERVLRACGYSAESRPIPSDPSASLPRRPLTRGEHRVLELLAQGLSNAAIAEKLFVARTTVNAHLRNINSKLGVHNRTQAVAFAQRQGLIAHRG